MPARPQPPAPDNRRMLALALAIGMTGLLMTVVPTIDRRLKSTFNERLARHAETLPAGAARLETRRLAARGVDAIPPLMRLAGSSNAAAADAARDAVLSQLAGWESDFHSHNDAAQLAARLDVLTKALDRWILSYDMTARAWADRLTLNLIRDCDALPVVEAAELLAQCDRILAAPPAVASESVATATPPQSPKPTIRSDAAAPRVATESAAQPLPQPQSLAKDPVVSAPTGDVRLLDLPTPTPLAQTPPPSSQPAEAPGASLPAPRVAASDARPLALPPPSESAEVIEIPSPQQVRLLLRRYRQMSDAALSQQLVATQGYDARAIRQVLRERNLPTAAGPSARPAVILSEAVERKILEQVSRLSPARGRQLLRTLATDATEDADVRLQALALLATSGDPMLPEIARRQAIEDADPRVAELATRIIREGVTE